MKKVKNIFHKIANADPMIWGYVMLNDERRKSTCDADKFSILKTNLINAERLLVNILTKKRLDF